MAYDQARMETHAALDKMSRRFKRISNSLKNRLQVRGEDTRNLAQPTREGRQHGKRDLLRRFSGHFKRQNGEQPHSTEKEPEQEPATQPATQPETAAPT
ncbi:hypothetical protein H4R20_005961, partial [Coemansia guatemalensis]